MSRLLSQMGATTMTKPEQSLLEELEETLRVNYRRNKTCDQNWTWRYEAKAVLEVMKKRATIIVWEHHSLTEISTALHDLFTLPEPQQTGDRK